MVKRMERNHRTRLAHIQDFDQLVKYLHDEMDWPINTKSFDEEVFEYNPEELGIDARSAAKIREIKRLRPLEVNQPWGIFFVKFEPKYLPVVALRRILGHFANRKRNKWEIEDLLFISNYGQNEQRQISFAHFSPQNEGLPILKVIAWDDQDTALHLDKVAQQLTQHLIWPENVDQETWRKQWRGAFTISHGHVVRTAKELSVHLAELARKIRKRIIDALEIETEEGYITNLMKSFQEALVHEIEHDSFADMVAQTITYGILSARITDQKQNENTDLISHMRTNPLLSDLMSVFLRISSRTGDINFDELGVVEVEEFLSNTDMDSVVRDFGDRNPREDPVIHFYENFLADYDKEKKVERGVFYTPRPVVSYIVRSIDALLRDEFGLVDGLADTSSWGDVIQCNREMKVPANTPPESYFVRILDPAAGTGTFLVEVIDLIYSTLEKKWQEQGRSELQIGELWNKYVPNHLLPRLYGYELLMAPYVIAHFKISLKLYETGYRFDSDERARVYLTNTLEPAKNHTSQFSIEFPIPALANEAVEVDNIKRQTRFTIVLGNPPYSGHSANKGDWIRNLLRGDSGARSVENYFNIEGRPLNEKNPKWLNDDYVKFTRFAHWQIERTGQGIVGFITNHGYLDNPTFRGMRESLVATFPTHYVIDLHGNIKKKERSPDGGKDENVFDIQQGVAIGLFVKSGQGNGKQHNRFDLWGRREQANRAGKYDWLEENTVYTTNWTSVSPQPSLWLFAARDDSLWNEYGSGWHLTEIFPVSSVGIVTARDKLAIQFTEEDTNRVVKDFADRETEEARKHYELGKDAKDWKVALAQEDVLSARGKVIPILYRPFDTRYTYYTGKSRGFICRPRLGVMRHMLRGKNLGLVCCRQQSQVGVEWRNFGITQTIIEACLISNKTKEINYLFPLYSFERELEEGYDKAPNIDQKFIKALRDILGLEFLIEKPGDHRVASFCPEDILAYIYAVFHSTGYRQRYKEQLRLDFPRVPLPQGITIFRNLVQSGYDLLTLHLLESPKLNIAISTYSGTRNSLVGRVGWSNGTIWLDAGEVSAQEGYRATKCGTFGFHGVPEDVWDFHIGSYQVCQKWLSYREGRLLTDGDIAHYLKIITALKETIPIMNMIDDAIEAHGGWPKAFASAVRSNPHQPVSS